MLIDVDAFATVGRQAVAGARFVGARALTGGVSTDVHAIDLEDRDGRMQTVVVRQHRAKSWKSGPADIATREYRLLEFLHQAGVPVPRPLSLGVGAATLPGPYLVIEFVEGSTELGEQPVSDRVSIAADALVRVHSLPLDQLPKLPTRADPLPEVFDYVPDEARWQPIRTALERITAPRFDSPPTLLHGDFWPGNLLWRDGRLVAILDWEDAAVGDPLSDLASGCLEVLYAYGQDAAERFVRRYEEQSTIDRRRFALWRVYVAAAGCHFMGEWGLPAEREARMRAQAFAFIQDAATDLND